MNDKIERNYYFFVDIMRKGIMLFDSGNYTLSEPKDLNPAQRVEKSTEEFEHWFKSATRFLERYEFFHSKSVEDPDYYRKAAFELHKAI